MRIQVSNALAPLLFSVFPFLPSLQAKVPQAGAASRPVTTRPAPAQDPLAPQDKLGKAMARRMTPPLRSFCSGCHGTAGRGDGPMARFLDPKPLDFSQGRFKLTDTVGGLPTQERLIATVREGLPGAAMPSFHHFPPHMVKMAVRGIMGLLREKIRQELLAEGKKGEELEKALALALKVGTPIKIPSFQGHSFDLKRGKEIYAKNCAVCHGPKGTGKTIMPLMNAKGERIQARDFRSGVFKGGANMEDLWQRVRGGIPYSNMPAFSQELISDSALMDLIAFVRSFVPTDPKAAPGPDGRRIPRFRMEPKPNPAKMVKRSKLPVDPKDPAWKEVPAVSLNLVPFSPKAATRGAGAKFQAVHDGKRAAFRLSWEDPSPEPADLAGIQLCLGRRSLHFFEARFPTRRYSIFGPAWFFQDGRVRAERPNYFPPKVAKALGLPTDPVPVQGPKVEARSSREGARRVVVFVRDLAVPAHPGAAGRAKKLPDNGPVIELPIVPGTTISFSVFLSDASRAKGLKSWAYSVFSELEIEN
ncbi:MAG TPA: c-type cytochrome [Planctomycetes bacterium]|nr:c-type cytochrome [Planctomycetota bacterium]